MIPPALRRREMPVVAGNEIVEVDAFTDDYDPSVKRANAEWLARRGRSCGTELDLVRSAAIDGSDQLVATSVAPLVGGY